MRWRQAVTAALAAGFDALMAYTSRVAVTGTWSEGRAAPR